MRRWLARRQWLAVAIGVVAAGILFTCYRGRPERAPVGLGAARVTEQWLSAVREKAAHGYWLAVRGTHPGDQLVAAATAAELTHVAVYDSERTEVIEAVGSGVARSPLRELLAQARRLQIIRPRDYDADKGRAAVERARGRVGASYDFLGTLGLPQDRRLYCSELALDAYRGRELGWIEGVLHPERMADLGEVVFDSGMIRDATPAAAISAALEGRFAKMIDGARGVAYAAEVTPWLLRGGAPDDEGIAWLTERGVRTVVNLRHYHGESEGEAVRAAGMRYERIAMESTDAPEPEQVESFLRIIADETARPIYVHCLHGVDRTGTMIAVYRIDVEGWSNADALAEMEWFGAHGLLHDLRRFVGRYTPTRE